MVAAAVILAVVAEDDWSWGSTNGKPPAKGSERKPRLMNSGKLVFEDPDIKGRSPRVDLGSRYDSRHPTLSTLQRPASTRPSFHTADTPVVTHTSHGGVDIHVPNSPGSVNVPISVTVDTTERNARKLAGHQPADSEGRFLGLGKRLCKMGIGHGCDKVKVKGKVNYVNIDALPYLPQPIVQPQPLHPPTYQQPGVPYGGGIQQSDVYHVQPVALQPVGSPIQAIPLGPSGGQVPHHSGGHAQLHSNPQVQNLPYSIPTPAHQHNLEPSYQEPVHRPADYKKDNTLVQHIHKHTHIYHGDKPQGNSGSYRPSRSHTNLAAIPPHPNSLYSTTGYREACECVPVYDCASRDVVGRASGSLLDARQKDGVAIYSNNTATEEHGSTPPSRRRRDAKTVDQAPADAIPRSREGRRIGYSPGRDGCYRGDVCCRNPGRSGDLGLGYSCGRRHSSGVVGRVKTPHHEPGLTDFGEYPWQAAILRRDGDEMVYVCGASLVSDRHVITAAHCVNKLTARDLQVRLGEWDVANDDEFYPHIDSGVHDIIIHRDFYAGMLHNDIALLKLNRHVDFVNYPHISPVCLPQRGDHFEGSVCHVTGWGKDAFGTSGSFQKILKRVEVPVVRKSSCEHALQDTRLGRSFRLHDGMSCAGGEQGKDACKGDGGGPLVCKARGGEYQLAGIVSWGIGCGERGLPGVYVDVPFYVDWINQHARP